MASGGATPMIVGKTPAGMGLNPPSVPRHPGESRDRHARLYFNISAGSHESNPKPIGLACTKILQCRKNHAISNNVER
jgi:hypothetical protein